MEIENIIIDPSPFSSFGGVGDLISILEAMEYGLSERQLTVILPSRIYNILIKIIKGDLSNDLIEDFIEVYKIWLPFYSKDHLREIIYGLTIDKKYLSIVKDFFDKFKPNSADKYVEGSEKIGRESIYLKDFERKFGKIVGEILFEVMVVSSKFKAYILCFGKRTATLISQLGIKILSLHSKYKKTIKNKSRIRRALRIMIYITGSEIFKEVINTLSPTIPPIITDMGRLGILILANG